MWKLVTCLLNLSSRIEHVNPLASLIVVLNLLTDTSRDLTFFSYNLQTVLSTYCFVYWFYIVCLTWFETQVYCVKDIIHVDSILNHYIELHIWESRLKVNLNISYSFVVFMSEAKFKRYMGERCDNCFRVPWDSRSYSEARPLSFVGTNFCV